MKDIGIQIDYGREIIAKHAKEAAGKGEDEGNFDKFKRELKDYHDQLANINSESLVEIVSAYQLIKDIVSEQDTLDVYEKKISLLPDLEKGIGYYGN